MIESCRPKRGHRSGRNNERGLLSGFPGTEDGRRESLADEGKGGKGRPMAGKAWRSRKWGVKELAGKRGTCRLDC